MLLGCCCCFLNILPHLCFFSFVCYSINKHQKWKKYFYKKVLQQHKWFEVVISWYFEIYTCGLPIRRLLFSLWKVTVENNGGQHVYSTWSQMFFYPFQVIWSHRFWPFICTLSKYFVLAPDCSMKLWLWIVSRKTTLRMSSWIILA